MAAWDEAPPATSPIPADLPRADAGLESAATDARVLDGGTDADPWWAKRNREDGGCGDRLYYTAPWAFELHFPELAVQAAWQLDLASDAGSEAPLRGTFVYRGAEPDDLPLRCKFHEPCALGGSRIRLSGDTGEVVVHLHLAPDELPELRVGSELRVDAQAGSGTLTLADRDGALLIGLVRPGASPSLASYTLGMFEVQKGAAVCFATQEMCNYRVTVHEIEVARGAQRWQLAPGEHIEASGYRIENHFATRQGSALPDAATCAAARTELDAISIVRSR